MDTNDISRRRFLQVGAVAAGAAITDPAQGAANARARAKSCILLMLVGGPSQLETFDPKPDAPAEVRGPFASIATSVTGVRVSEHLPRLAGLAHRMAIVRTVLHDAAPVHEAGLQLLQTGRLSRGDVDAPHLGTNITQHFANAGAFVVLPTLIGNTGLNVSRGQSAGMTGLRVESQFVQHLASTDRDRFGKTSFGDACARARQLVEGGTRCVVVNMFDTLYDRITWDCHADGHSLASTLGDYRRTLCPTFDRAAATLIDDLHKRGLLDETLVVAMGEIGRTPRLNAHGGRDHWPGCWSILMAGGGVRGGQVVGTSDRLAAEPARRPVTCAEVFASIHHAMGVPCPGATPIRELFDAV